MAQIRLEKNEALPSIVADYVANVIANSIEQKGHCYCALSGGSSPKSMLAELAKQPLPWEQVTLLMVDERFTTDKSQQNETMLRDFVNSIPGGKPALIALLSDTSLDAAIAAANNTVAQIPGALDIAVLGMGLDGHTASLFPDSTDYQMAMTSSDHYVKVVPGAAPHPRISMSYHWLLTVKNLVLYIPGRDKLDCYRHLVANPDALSPITSLTSQANNLTVFSSED